MAGLGRKVFTAGEVLEASEVNGYLMDQSVMVFAGTAERTSAIGTPSEGMFSYRTDDNILEYYTGSVWQEYAATTTTGDNLLYNGAMQITQRGTAGTAITTTNGYYTADRWLTDINNIGTWDQTVEADGPDGFASSLKMATTDSTSLSADSLLRVVQRLEGRDVQRIAKGTAGAKQVTLSFWLKTNVSGTGVAELVDQTNSRSVSATYTLPGDETWTKTTVTFPADTTGAIDNDSNAGLDLSLWLAAGSDYTSGALATTWQSNVSADRAVGQTNISASTGNFWQVTGVKLETGTVATGFDHKPYGVELAECQRYYQLVAEGDAQTINNIGFYTNTDARGIYSYKQEMRVAPSLEITSGTEYYYISVNNTVDYIDDFVLLRPTPLQTQFRNSTDVSSTAGNFGQLQTNDAAAFVGLDSEL